MSRLDKLKQQHPEFNISIIDLMGMIDPTDTYKYTEFLIKQLKEWFDGKTHEETQLIMGAELIGEDNVVSLNEFEIHCRAARIKKNDIGQHSGFRSIKDSVKDAEQIQKQKDTEKQVIKLLDNDEYCVVIPLSYDASRVYGSNTKWCTTQERYWNDYIDKYKLIYIIDRINNDKYAVSIKQGDSTKIQGWLSDDKEVSPLTLPISVDVINIIISEIKKDETIMDLEDYKKIHSKINESKSKIDVGNQHHDSISQMINQYITGIDTGFRPNNQYTTYTDYLNNGGVEGWSQLYRRRN
jgi:hypothetical protein